MRGIFPENGGSAAWTDASWRVRIYTSPASQGSQAFVIIGDPGRGGIPAPGKSGACRKKGSERSHFIGECKPCLITGLPLVGVRPERDLVAVPENLDPGLLHGLADLLHRSAVAPVRTEGEADLLLGKAALREAEEVREETGNGRQHLVFKRREPIRIAFESSISVTISER